ncbi:unnamed protein product [Diplocarpon coronariae]|uniref:Uncharacterized protein n=1 Tax=Diplocarpon coronariae TaxID=2795749 RepID=A0A218YYD2_9HELO|nr:hypothetical protein B2J93_1470 [Marssonina coronariae]
MFSKTILIAAFFAATSVLATSGNEARQLVQQVKVCGGAGFADCDNIPFNFGHCVQNIGRLNDKVSSLDSNGYRCIFYNDTGCRNGGGQISATGEVDNIRTSAQNSQQNDDISSFLCNI